MSGRLWLDASVIRKPATLRRIAELARDRGIEVLVHAHVHLEICRHNRATLKDRYTAAFVESFLEQWSVKVMPVHIDQATADRWAERLHLRYPSDELWEEAKHATLGGELRAEFVHEPGRMPMTTDWWVALEAEDSPDDRVAVDDKGGEWRALREVGRALSARDTVAWLEAGSPSS